MSNSSARGYLYISGNTAIIGFVKLGFSRRHPQTNRSLTVGVDVPGTLLLHYWCDVSDVLRLKRFGRQRLDKHLVSKKRDIFSIKPQTAVSIIRKCIADLGIHVYEQHTASDVRETARRERATQLREEEVTLLEEREQCDLRARGWNPFLKGQRVDANARLRSIDRRLAEIHEQLAVALRGSI